MSSAVTVDPSHELLGLAIGGVWQGKKGASAKTRSRSGCWSLRIGGGAPLLSKKEGGRRSGGARA
jgi:hypothetical protein